MCYCVSHLMLGLENITFISVKATKNSRNVTPLKWQIDAIKNDFETENGTFSSCFSKRPTSFLEERLKAWLLRPSCTT